MREGDLVDTFLVIQGFELFDPFIPVKVDIYSEKEIYSALEYFTDRHWIQHPDGKSSHLSARDFASVLPYIFLAHTRAQCHRAAYTVFFLRQLLYDF